MTTAFDLAKRDAWTTTRIERTMTDVIQISTTTANALDAGKIASALVERRLAACVQVSGPIVSRYRWDGQVEESTEWLCTAKTTRNAYQQVESTIREQHPYDVPEIIAVPVVTGSDDYLQWVRAEVSVDAD